MKLDALYEFVVFSKHLNFSQAAKELYLSQPALSIHMSNLEKELGFTLIDRDNGPTLTPAGLMFLDCAQDMLERYRSTVEACKAVSDAPPLVRILASHDDPLFKEFTARSQDIPFTLVSVDSEIPVLRALEKNLMDIGFCIDFSCSPALRQEAERNGMAWFPVGRSAGSISMMKQNPLAQKKALTREDLRDASIVINGGAHYDSWKAIVQESIGYDIPLKFKLDPIGSISNLAFADFGDSVHICGSQANDMYLANRDDVVIFDTLDGEPLLYTSVAVYRKDDPNENVHAIVAELKALLEHDELAADLH